MDATRRARLLLSLLVYLLGGMPAAALAQARRPASPEPAAVPLPPPPAGTELRTPPGWRLGAGVEGVFSLDSKSGTGVGLKLEAIRPWRTLGADADLDLVLAATLGYWGRSQDVLLASSAPGLPALATGSSESRAALVRAVPAARISWRGFPGNRRIGLYGEGGLGIGLSFVSTQTDVTYQGKATAGETRFAVVVRLAGGGWYQVSDGLRLWLQPVGLDLALGSGSSTYGLAAGVTFPL